MNESCNLAEEELLLANGGIDSGTLLAADIAKIESRFATRGSRLLYSLVKNGRRNAHA